MPSFDRVDVAVPAAGGARVRLRSRALDVSVLRVFAHGLVARGIRLFVGDLGFSSHKVHSVFSQLSLSLAAGFWLSGWVGRAAYLLRKGQA
jgi:hypothetical protein